MRRLARILVSRQDLTKEDRKLAGSYETGTVIRFQSGSADLAIKAKDYAAVIDRDTEKNTVTAKRPDGEAGYLQPESGTTAWKSSSSSYAMSLAAWRGDCVSDAPARERGITTGDRATIETLDPRGNVKLRMEEKKPGRDVQPSRSCGTSIMPMRPPATARKARLSDRVLVHKNTAEKGAKAMLNSAMAYVSLSRPRNEIKLYTDDVKRLARLLENSEVKKVALRPEAD